MKKFFRAIALLLLPVLLYFGVFVLFEPNNYFGLRKNATGTDIMAALRNYEDSPQNAVILGDSRTAKLDLDAAAAITGRRYANLSYGGASLKEQLDLLDWAVKTNPALDEVVFGLSFYTLNEGYAHDRNIIQALGNPFVYMTNLGYNINMLTSLYEYLRHGAVVGDAGETMEPSAYTYVPYAAPDGARVTLRETIANHLKEVSGRAAGWVLNEAEFGRLLETIARCEERGIRVCVVLPPQHDDMLRYVVQAYGIDAPMADVLRRLRATPAVVLDYEMQNRPDLRDDEFYDGFHLDSERGLPVWSRMLFEDLAAGHR